MLPWKCTKKEVAELKGKEALTKESSIKEFKSSDDYMEAVEETTSYLGESFDLCFQPISS